MNNPRYANGNLRRKMRRRFIAMGLPCAICGRPIHYDEPSDSKHPLSFVIDEIRPVSRWGEFLYPSPFAAALDPDNVQPAHWICNARKGAKTMSELRQNNNQYIPEDYPRETMPRKILRGYLAEDQKPRTVVNLPDGEW